MSPSTEAGRRLSDEEADWQVQVTGLAAIYGWEWVHFRPAQTAHGWRTPVEGSLGKGWPDLVLVHPHRCRVMFVELKRDGEQLTPHQASVLEVLAAAGAVVHTWRPRDWEQVMEELR